ncbi:MAG TPA: hypothetical protein VHX15_15690, partial [Frankiaceae bacterium]|nr:hypothetical protein [Frankiaceae bacterium]
MAYTVGDAQVPVTPDFRNFHTAIDEEVDSMEAKFAAAGDSSGKKFGDAFGAQVKASFADLPDATVKAGADTTKLDADLDAATKDRTATVRENADTTAATAQLAELQRKIDVLKAQKAGIKVTLDASSLDVSIAKAEAELDALTKRSYTVKLKAVADTSAVKMVDELLSPAVLGAAGLATALGPTAAAAALGVAGIGVAFGAAASDAGAFGIIAKGMFTDVTTAQKALTTAQGAYAKATTPAARAKALAAEKAATDGLTSSEKQLLVQVNSLESGWKKLT